MRIHFTPKSGLIPSFLFTLPFFAVGGWSVHQAWSLYQAGGDWTEAGIFAGVGIMAILLSIAAIAQAWKHRKVEQRREALRDQYRDAPWKMRSEWRTARIEASGSDRGTGGLSFAIIWNLIAWPMAGWILMTEFSNPEPDYAALMVLLFPLVGIVVGGFAVREILRRRKFGDSVLELETMPVPLGGRLRGRLETGVKVTSGPDEGFDVNLSCYRRTVRRERSNGKTRTKVEYSLLWRDEKRMRSIPFGDSSRLAVPVSFELPDDQPTSTPEKLPNRIVWRLEVEAAVPGIDYSAQVELPVFDGVPASETGGASAPEAESGAPLSESDPMFLDLAEEHERVPTSAEPEEDGYAEHEIRQEIETPVSPGIEMRELPSGGLEFFFDRARNMTTVLVVTGVFVALLAGMGLLLFLAEGIPFLALLFMALFTALFGWLTYRQWTYTSTVRVKNGRLSVVQGPFGRGEPTVFLCRELVEVKVSVTGQTNNKAQYRLEAVRSSAEAEREAAQRAGAIDDMASMLGAGGAAASDGTSVVDQMKKATTDATRNVQLADNLSNKAEADWIAAKIEEAARRVRA